MGVKTVRKREKGAGEKGTRNIRECRARDRKHRAKETEKIETRKQTS